MSANIIVSPEAQARHDAHLAERDARLLNDAREQGITLSFDRVLKATVAVAPGSVIRHVVHEDLCSCRMFQLWGCCPHIALFRAESSGTASPVERSHVISQNCESSAPSFINCDVSDSVGSLTLVAD